MFLKRYAELMGTILNEEYFVSTIDRIVAMIQPDMAQDRARWGQSYSGWEKSVEGLRTYFAGGKRTRTILNSLRSYFNLTDDQMEYYFGSVK